MLYYLNKSDLVINTNLDGEIDVYTYTNVFWRKGLQKYVMIIKIEKILNFHISKLREELHNINKNIVLENRNQEKKLLEGQANIMREKINHIDKHIKALNNNTFKNIVLKELQEFVLPQHVNLVNVEFDNKTPNVFVFANVAYDLTTRKPYEIKKEEAGVDAVRQIFGYMKARGIKNGIVGAQEITTKGKNLMKEYNNNHNVNIKFWDYTELSSFN